MHAGKIIRPGLFTALLLFALSPFQAPAQAGDYLTSAHGNTSYGVNRNSIAGLGYGRGNCAHCHEQHASIQGAEPDPIGGPSDFALFADNYLNQTTNFCFYCHTDVGSLQSDGAVINRSYGFRAGGWTADSLDDLKEAFSFTSPGSSHNLGDIRNFIAGRWNYTSASNPCVACHNPHAAQGDPANQPSSPKSVASRGWPVSRPSEHSLSVWSRWGDDASEKMSNYTSNYQAPYRYNSTSSYEPDGSSTQNGSNLTDFNTFCTDCHNPTNTISSTTLGRDLKKIDWSSDKHGLANADQDIDMVGPYPATLGKVLSCTDCHEPHGSTNAFLLRKEVNGSVLSGVVSSGTKDFGYLCRQCHKDDAAAKGGTANKWEYAHHQSGDKPYMQGMGCGCHGGGGGMGGGMGGGGMNASPIPCQNCHFHGSWVNDPNNPNDVTPSYSPTTRTTF